MGGIKDVGAKPVSTQQTESSKPQTPAGSAQPSPAEATSQPLTQEGKSAKTMESGIAGEAMRQKVMLAAEAGSAIAGIGGLVAAQKGIGAAAAKAAKAVLQKAQSNQVMSPSGVPYKPEARVPDNTPIFTGGKIDREKVLQSLSQHDQNAKTTEDKDRCGGTAAIASAINSGGDAGLLKLTKAMKSNLPAKSLKELNEIEEKIKNKTATHGDLGRLSELIHNGFAQPDANGSMGVLDGDMHTLYTQAGLNPPAGPGLPEKIFKNGQSWPVNLDTDGDGTPNHWVVAGKDERGRTFIYDPDSTPGKPQIHYQDSAEYDNYIRQMQKTQSGFAPMNKADADKAREKYEQSTG